MCLPCGATPTGIATDGILSKSTTAVGVDGTSTATAGVVGTSTTTNGVVGTSAATVIEAGRPTSCGAALGFGRFFYTYPNLVFIAADACSLKFVDIVYCRHIFGQVCYKRHKLRFHISSQHFLEKNSFRTCY